MPFQLVQITAQSSNTVLAAIMPYVSDFTSRLDLPIAKPVAGGMLTMDSSWVIYGAADLKRDTNTRP